MTTKRDASKARAVALGNASVTNPKWLLFPKPPTESAVKMEQDQANIAGSSQDVQHFNIRDYLDNTAKDWKRVVAMAILYEKATTSHAINLAMFSIVSRRRAALGMGSVTEEKRMSAATRSKEKADSRIQALQDKKDKKLDKAKAKREKETKKEVQSDDLFDLDEDLQWEKPK